MCYLQAVCNFLPKRPFSEQCNKTEHTSTCSTILSVQCELTISLILDTHTHTHNTYQFTYTTFTLQKWVKPAGPAVQTCWAGLAQLTSVQFVKQTGLTCAGPQKCARVNVVY